MRRVLETRYTVEADDTVEPSCAAETSYTAETGVLQSCCAQELAVQQKTSRAMPQ